MVRRSARLAAADTPPAATGAARALAIPEILELVVVQALEGRCPASASLMAVNSLWNATVKGHLFQDIEAWHGRLYLSTYSHALEITSTMLREPKWHMLVRSLCLTGCCPTDRSLKSKDIGVDAQVIAKCINLRKLYLNAGALANWAAFQPNMPSTMPNLRFMRLTLLPDQLSAAQQQHIMGLVGSATHLKELCLAFSVRYFAHESNILALSSLLSECGQRLESLELEMSIRERVILDRVADSVAPHIQHLRELHLNIDDLYSGDLSPLIPSGIRYISLFCHPLLAESFLILLANPANLPKLESVPVIERYHDGDAVPYSAISKALQGLRARSGISNDMVDEITYDHLLTDRPPLSDGDDDDTGSANAYIFDSSDADNAYVFGSSDAESDANAAEEGDGL